MELVESLRWSHDVLTRLQVPHALIGGMALSEYGYGRGTQDVDWLIPEEHADRVVQHFQAEGFQVFHRSADVLQFTGRAEIDFLIARRPMSRAMIDHAPISDQLDLPVVLPEDLIGLKIQAYAGNPKRRSKELTDIQELIENCEDLDWKKIRALRRSFSGVADPGESENFAGEAMTRIVRGKRHLSGQAYLRFLEQYLRLFKPKKVREKILGPFLL